MSVESWIARRVMSGCSHSVPIVIPCIECVTNTLNQWEKNIRADCAKLSAERYKDIEETSVADADRLRQINSKLNTVVATLESEVASLRIAMKGANEVIANMRAQLHAENAFKTLKNTVDNTAKASEQ